MTNADPPVARIWSTACRVDKQQNNTLFIHISTMFKDRQIQLRFICVLKRFEFAF